MRAFSRGLGLAALCVGLLGLTGCQEDNEASIKQQAATSGGGDSAKQPTEYPKAPMNLDAMKNMKPPSQKAQGYPGAKQ